MLGCRSSLWACLAFLVVVSAAAPAPVQAQLRKGVQGGVSIDPDQFFFGGHLETAPLVDRVRFRPNADIGVGDDVTSFSFNFEFPYDFTSNRPWNLYAGAGPAINWVDSDHESDTEAGFNIFVGAKRLDGLSFELKIGAMGSPEVKFGVRYTFR